METKQAAAKNQGSVLQTTHGNAQGIGKIVTVSIMEDKAILIQLFVPVFVKDQNLSRSLTLKPLAVKQVTISKATV